MVEGILTSYFRDNTLVKQQLESYNKFLERGMQNIVDAHSEIETNVEGFSLRLGRIRVEKPRFYEVRGGYRDILPIEARMRNLTYSAPIFLEIIPVYNGVEKRLFSEVFIGELPIMVKSKVCHLYGMSEEDLINIGEDPDDPGGYFIINGSERVLVSIEDFVQNRLIVTKEDKDAVVAKVFSTRNWFRARCVVTRSKEGKLTIEFPGIPPNVPLMLILKVLGMSNEQIISAFSNKLVVKNDVLLNLEEEKSENQEEAIVEFARRIATGQPEEYRMARVNMVLDNYLLPHLGTEPEKRSLKAEYLVKMAERAILVAYNKHPADDKDHYMNKRVKLAGELMEELFNYALQFFIRDMVYQASRVDARGRRLQVHTLVRQDVLSDRIMYAMATGTWIAGQTGVSQLLDRTSYLATLSHLRRLISPLSKKHPHFKARDLHGTHWGKVCPSETPEGPSCSLVKNFALLAEISTGSDEGEVEKVVKHLGVE